ncbi:DNA gyrase inhibitor [Edwardsiella ictaluri]|uniref:GyrI-like domain-containing protein n=1 Tax=Edwardsiella ictaluri TaxID=67780 RepID=UPI0009C04D54|nr:GyrI-like domain-containing protein [Edwardsiella ictaluri]ARD40715.1 DNA gyrase inhibitor [Edwardsiella ictaluri]QPW26263.1 DNA gyrase inhibitor [Edwardsiella ictaluri]
MQVRIVSLAAQPLFVLRVQGPFAQSLGPGFERLMAWSARHGLRGQWMALYYDNPREVAPDALRADVALTTASVTLLSDGEAYGIRRGALAGGLYALAQVRVTDNDFATPWIALFDQALPACGYRPDGGPCFERYLSDGRGSGEWLLELGVPVRKN